LRTSFCLPIFRKLDPAGKGLIRRDVIMEALTCYGDRMSADQLSEILRKTCDENNSGHNDEFFDYRYVSKGFWEFLGLCIFVAGWRKSTDFAILDLNRFNKNWILLLNDILRIDFLSVV
jgi:hypothetical protein